jgi:hypothetical protein
MSEKRKEAKRMRTLKQKSEVDTFQDVADVLQTTPEALTEELLAAACSGEFDQCLTWRDWEAFPLLEGAAAAHLAECKHCSAIRDLLENHEEAEEFARTACAR